MLIMQYLENYKSDFKKWLRNRIQRPWFQDNFFINVRKLFFVKILIAEWNSYLYGVFLL